MKKAFTLLELVFVIVVVGILAALIIPRTKTNPVQESAVDLLSKIRYTQHLALVDDQYDSANAAWYKNRWQIRFNGNAYSIVSDNNTNFAKDPSNVDANLTNIDLNAKYNVTISVTGTECGVGADPHILSFDYLGRPFAGDPNGATGPYSGVSLVQSNDCNITVSDGTESATINIAPETGYAKITFN